MDDFKKFFKSLILPLILFFVVCLPILFFNIIVDPYKVLFSRFPVSIYEPNKHYMKMKYLLNHKTEYDSFIFGSSRVNFINPDKIGGEKYFNMTYSAGIPSQHLENLNYLHKKGVKIKNLILGIDYYSFFTDPDIPIALLYQEKYPTNLSEKIDFFTPYIFNRPNLEFAKNSFKESPIDYSSILKTGIITALNADEEIEKNLENYIVDKRFNFPYSIYSNDSLIKKTINQIDSIIEFSERYNINLKIFINPTHYSTYLNLNLKEYYEALRKLSEITDYFDFSGLNSVAINNYNFYETSHFRFNVGDLIISKIFNQPNDQIPDDFGRLVTRQNIENQINFHEELFEDYLKLSEWPPLYVNFDEIGKLKKYDSSIQNVIESINGLNIRNLTEPVKITSPLIKIEGCEINKSSNKPDEKVYVKINDKLFLASYEIKRDVIPNTSSNPDYQNAKWRVVIPTTTIEKGVHELSVCTVSSKGDSYAISNNNIKLDILFTIENIKNQIPSDLGVTYDFAIDFANGRSCKYQPINITEDKINIRGWAIDKLGNSISGGVIVYLDDKPFLSQFQFLRPDIANYYNNQNYIEAGWGITIPYKDLSEGKHELTFKVLNKNRTGYYTTPHKIIVSNKCYFDQKYFKHLQPSLEETKCYIDFINGENIKKITFPYKTKQELIQISGWAIDLHEANLAKEVLVQIDDKIFKTNYGKDRPDVSKYLNNDQYLHSGWDISVPTSLIGKGKHSFSVIIVSKNDSVYYNMNNNLPFETN